jgi:hypothetical protein
VCPTRRKEIGRGEEKEEEAEEAERDMVSTISFINLYPTNVENWASSEQYSNILVYPTRCDVTHFIYIWKLLYILLCIRHPQHTQTSSNSSTIAADGSNSVTNTRSCRYSCMRS